ncbi:unnamed protein product [Paramecium primaurelia]|uniref:Retinoblastoma-associated protein A-box domain-containing protein n=1 Tax=Paramecium primaurelia TaxID=5886 RepID=A0A8S1MFR9_PARPR|nr:unnamed protein product [Paramecium primaurelia]
MYIEEFSNQLNLDQETLDKAKLAMQQFSEQDEKIYVPAVVYLCSQSCQIQQIDGQTKQGNGITLTQIIRNLDPQVDIEQFLMVLQDLPTLLKCHSTEFDNVVRQANFSFRLYKKFDKCFSLIQPVQNPSQTPQFKKEDDCDPYILDLKKVAWILCIIVRQNILQYEEQLDKNQLIICDPNTKVILILVGSLSIVFQNLPNTFTQNVEDISQKMLSFFCNDQREIDEELKYYQDLCFKCINQVVNMMQYKTKVLDMQQETQETQLSVLFEEKTIDQTYRRLHKYYEKTRKHSDLDEECFLRQRIVFTPKKDINKQVDYSEFETLQKKTKIKSDPPFMQTPLKDNKFSNTQEKTYFDIKKNAIPQTPISKCMELHQWIKKITMQTYKCFEDDDEQEFYNQATINIRKYFEVTESSKSSKQNEQTILTLCLAVIDSLMKSNEGQFDLKLLKNYRFQFAILGLSLYTYQIVIQKPNLLQNMKQLCTIFEISPLDLFRVIANFAHFHRQMPSTITSQLFELEKHILFNLMWQTDAEKLVEIFKDNSPKYFDQELVRRFQNHLALRVKELCKILQLDIHDFAYSAICEFMKNPKLDVLKDVIFDTVIICTFYVIQKHQKQSPSFNSYNKLYTQYYSQQKQVFTRIVEYYNERFLSGFRDIVKSISNAQPLQIPKNFECQSPLIIKQIPVSPNYRQQYIATPEPPSPQKNFMRSLMQKIKPQQQQQQAQQKQQDIQPFQD